MSSFIWAHFTRTSTSINCNYCEKEYGLRTTTANLTYHYNRRHHDGVGASIEHSSSSQESVIPYTDRRLSLARSVHIDECVAGFFLEKIAVHLQQLTDQDLERCLMHLIHNTSLNAGIPTEN